MSKCTGLGSDFHYKLQGISHSSSYDIRLVWFCISVVLHLQSPLFCTCASSAVTVPQLMCFCLGQELPSHAWRLHSALMLSTDRWSSLEKTTRSASFRLNWSQVLLVAEAAIQNVWIFCWMLEYRPKKTSFYMPFLKGKKKDWFVNQSKCK